MMTAAVAVRATLSDDTDPFTMTPGALLPGARPLLERLKAEGYFVLIADPMGNSQTGLAELVRWLNRNELPYDDVWGGSGIPPADLYVNGLAETPK